MTPTIEGYTETGMFLLWWNFHHFLHQKLSKRQHEVQPVIKKFAKMMISSFQCITDLVMPYQSVLSWRCPQLRWVLDWLSAMWWLAVEAPLQSHAAAPPWPTRTYRYHYNDVIMSTIASQITSLAIVYSTIYSGADQRKHQSSASLAFVWGIHRRPVNSLHKWPVTRKMFPFDDVIMC